MSQIYRSIAASTKTVSQALSIAGVATLAIVIYTGFVIPRPLMHPWFKWISWVNPVAYAFEALFVNELHGQEFDCSTLIPSGGSYSLIGNQFVCGAAGAVVGQRTVSGDAYLEAQVWTIFSPAGTHCLPRIVPIFVFPHLAQPWLHVCIHDLLPLRLSPRHRVQRIDK